MTDPAVAVTLPLVLPAVMLTELGIVRTALLSEMLTVEPPVGAACVSTTVQVLEAFGAKVVGLHAKDDSEADVSRLRLALCELLSYVAVMVAV